MGKRALRMRPFAWTAVIASLACLFGAAAQAQQPICSAWLIESSRFMNVPFGAFMPDRAFVPGSTNPQNNIASVDLPVNIGVIKCGNELILYDTGWKQQEYLKMTGSEHWAPLPDQLKVLGFNAADVTKVVIGHAHWDHAGQLSDLPNAVLYVQREELKAIEWALNYPEPHIRAINSDPGGCNRTPACGYMPLTMAEVYGKVLKGKAVIVDGEMEILPGVRIHPAFRAHTAGSQLLEVPTSVGKLVFGSDAFSSYEGIRDWMTANVQQTDTVQQFLAYEKCYKITGGFNNCVAAHEPLSYTDKYPLTRNSWVALNGGRMAEIALAPGEKSRKP
ncbi:MBL fold metallo-hydrolase [Vineibacter terrae]|uniref:MBL fold metallo-hydrolase n=1 Tax=Vineibacter terrae TaxID=2586908 RepID=UPI002E2F3012|nr:MBL fold metallo-hydrolase [Vineibacter terrae]HEX2888002.1 MBL fold metallo-hydrolase [Vineibacter terrae]